MKNRNILRALGISTVFLASSFFNICSFAMAEENLSPNSTSRQKPLQRNPNYTEMKKIREQGWEKIWNKLELKDFEGVLDDAEEIINKDPNNAQNYFNRAGVKKKLGDIQGYIDDVNKSIEMNPNDVEVISNIAVFHFQRKDYESAAQEYSRIINVDSNNATAYHMRGNCKSEMGQHKAALKDYAHVVKIEPNEPFGYLLRGRTFVQIGQMQKAKQELESAVQLNHANDNRKAFVYRYVGGIYADFLKQPEKAKEYLEIALELYQKLNNESAVGRLVEEIQELGSSN